MTPRAGKAFRTSARAEDLAVTHRHAAGIDVHAAVHFVAVPAQDLPPGFRNPDPKLPQGVRKFGSNTEDLEALAAWLKECGVTTVAMESTGLYWIPLYALLASRGFEVLLVDPRQTKHAPGRPKSDVLDCQWIGRLHSYGLLTGSFRPGDAIVRWRGFQRHRDMLIRYAAQHVQHMQKTLEEMNVKLTEVVSDIVGLTGLKIIKDIVRGVRDPVALARHRHANCQRTEAEIAKALHGTWRHEHVFALQQALQLYEFYQKQLRACEAQIEACLRSLEDKSQGAPLPPRSRKSKGAKNEVHFGARALLFKMAGVDVTVLEGISESTALVLLSELGTDLSGEQGDIQHIYWPNKPLLRTLGAMTPGLGRMSPLAPNAAELSVRGRRDSLSGDCWVVLVLLLVLLGHRFVPPHWRYLSRTKRRAMCMAVRAARQLHRVEVVWANCFIRRRDQQKCFVFLQQKYIGRPEPYSVFAVWRENDQVDDLGAWVFHWGLFFPSQPMDAYEECRAAGVPWPMGVGDWLEWSKQQGNPV